MATRTEVMQRIFGIIGQRGQSNSVIDRALEVFDAVVSHKPIPESSVLSKSLPVVPNREPGQWTKKTDAINDRNTSETQPKTDGKKDDRPVNRMHWRVKHPDGRLFSYTMHPNGSMKVSLVGAQQTKTYTLAEWSKMHHDSQDNNKEKKDMGTLSKAKEPRRWGQPARSLHDPLVNVNTPRPVAAPAATRPTTPAPNMAQNLRASRNTAPLTGHEMAAVKQGVNLSKLPAGTDLARMDKGQMASLAHTQLLEATEPMFLASGKLYRR